MWRRAKVYWKALPCLPCPDSWDEDGLEGCEGFIWHYSWVPEECVDEYLRIAGPHLLAHCYSVAGTDYVAWRETVQKGALLALPLNRADGRNRQWRSIGLEPPPFQQTLEPYSQSYDRENTDNFGEDALGNIGLIFWQDILKSHRPENPFRVRAWPIVLNISIIVHHASAIWPTSITSYSHYDRNYARSSAEHHICARALDLCIRT